MPKQMVRHAFWLGSFNIVMGGVVGGTFTWNVLRGGWSSLYFDPLEHGVPWLIASAIVGLFTIDAGLYYSHRFLHRKMWFRHVHRWHHRYTAPVMWTTTAVHPLEFLFFQFFVMLPAILVPMHWAVYLLIAGYTYLIGMIDHCGISVNWPLPLHSGNRFHDDHHVYFHCNYGHHTQVFDQLHGDRAQGRAAVRRRCVRWPRGADRRACRQSCDGRRRAGGVTESQRFDAAESLARRMAKPQRHRLLQGYPALPLMQPVPDAGEPPFIEIDRSRRLIVGVIPHTMCTPKRHGCGFCTFGQSSYRRAGMRHSMHALPHHIDKALAHDGHAFAGRKVEALYFGGGTANLTPIGDLEATFARLAESLNLRDAELTLEGVPSLFLSRFSAALRWLAKLPVRRARVSMGVQSFDREQLRRMGREHFGDAALVRRVVGDACKRGIGTSGDFLFNLPHQTRAQMLADLEQAVAIGFDQICIYHLVLYEGLGTSWSRDPALLAALPSGEQALENWLALREALLAAGYVQTTLTNFERADVNADDRRFIYEASSFTPDEVDGLGIGPLSISTFVDLAQRRALKLVRTHEHGISGDRYFAYEPVDVELLFLTRSLPRMRWSAAAYQRHFGAALDDAHGEVIEAIVAAGLAERSEGDVVVTPRGMFFADSIAGLLAERRVAELRERDLDGLPGVHTQQFIAEYHMG